MTELLNVLLFLVGGGNLIAAGLSFSYRNYGMATVCVVAAVVCVFAGTH